jgi:toxin ParE1/3/4
MTYRIVYGSKVESDLTETYDYYEEQLDGLGSEFLLAVEATINSVQRNPLHFQKVDRKKRKANLKRFPFGIFYLVSKEYIFILAVIHLTRDPKTWKSRKV